MGRRKEEGDNGRTIRRSGGVTPACGDLLRANGEEERERIVSYHDILAHREFECEYSHSCGIDIVRSVVRAASTKGGSCRASPAGFEMLLD